MPEKEILSIRRSSGQVLRSVLQRHHHGSSWSSSLDYSFSSGSPSSTARVETKVVSVMMKKHVHQGEVNFTHLLSSFIGTNYLLVVCSGFYNLKITPFKKECSLTELNVLLLGNIVTSFTLWHRVVENRIHTMLLKCHTPLNSETEKSI